MNNPGAPLLQLIDQQVLEGTALIPHTILERRDEMETQEGTEESCQEVVVLQGTTEEEEKTRVEEEEDLQAHPLSLAGIAEATGGEEETQREAHQGETMMRSILISLVRTKTKYLVISSGMDSSGLRDQILPTERALLLKQLLIERQLREPDLRIALEQ